MSIIRIIKDIISYAGTLLLAIYGAVFFEVNAYIKGKWQFIFVLLYFEVMLLLLRLLLKKINLSHKIKRVHYILIFFLACITAFAVRDKMEINFPQETVTVRISATGEKNEQSKGNEIWLKEISIDGIAADLNSIWHDSFWNFNQDVNSLVATPPEEGSTIQFSCNRARTIKLEFQTTAYSGIVEIEEEGNIERVDLYEEETGNKMYQVDTPTYTTRYWEFYSYISSVILFIFIYYALVALYVRRIDKRRGPINASGSLQ